MLESRLKAALLVLIFFLGLQLCLGAFSIIVAGGVDSYPPSKEFLNPSNVMQGVGDIDAIELALQERPVFWQSRRPLELTPQKAESGKKKQPAVPDKNDPINGAKLLGIFRSDVSGVIVEYEGRRVRLRMGESVDGWTLSTLDAEEASFSSGRMLVAVRLEHAFVKAPPPTAVGQVSESEAGSDVAKTEKLDTSGI